MELKKIIRKLNLGKDLSLDESIETAEQITNKYVDPILVTNVLMGLYKKGYTVDEIVGFAEYGRKCTHTINPSNKNQVVDIVGTGADKSSTFNISTAAAFVVAGAGVPVAKYGNKAVSSKSGSSDVLEALGIDIYQDFGKIESCLEEIGLVFMNAQQFNTTFKYIAPIRKNLGVPTIFNIIGPLTNPINPKYIAMGMYDSSLTEIVAQAADKLGYKKGLFFHGDGLDEITITGKTKITKLTYGNIKTIYFDPRNVRMEYGTIDSIQVKNKEESASIILDILKGKKLNKLDKIRRNIVILNASAALIAAEKADNFNEGIKMAEQSIDSGNAYGKYREIKNI